MNKFDGMTEIIPNKGGKSIWNEDTYENINTSGAIETLKYLYENECEWEEYKYDDKGIFDPMKTIRYLYSSGNKICYVCDMYSSNTKICSKCKIARYCSRECQIKDWNEHKHICGTRRRRFKC